MKVFCLPDLGEGLQEAEVLTWHVAEGDRVVADQPLLSVETDKAVVEVPSPYSGVIGSLKAESGEVVAVGAVLVEYTGQENQESQGSVVGSLATKEVEDFKKSIPDNTVSRNRVSPAVRALARKLGVKLENITPSGRRGNITSEDVLAARKGVGIETPSLVKPLRGMRRTMAQRMSEAHSRVVPISVYDEVDIGAWTEESDLTARAIHALVAACLAEPALNIWFNDEVETIVSHEQVNVGFAVDSPDGLFVPVLRNANKKKMSKIRTDMADLVKQVKERSIPGEDLRGATITLSNYGALGVRFAAMIVVPPQVAIVGIGKIRDDAVVENGAVKVTRILPISATFDHRVVTGGEGARFLQAFIENLCKSK